MNAESDNFEALRKLLALKRYEQPPPGYFNQLPGRILSRIEREEPTFMEKLARVFVFRPAMAYALGLAFCGTFAAGLGYSLHLRTEQMAQQRNPLEPWDIGAFSNLNPSHEDSTQFPDLHVRGYDNFTSATNDSAPKPSLFQSFEGRPAAVSYSFGH